jgi:hypothetical protein
LTRTQRLADENWENMKEVEELRGKCKEERGGGGGGYM